MVKPGNTCVLFGRREAKCAKRLKPAYYISLAGYKKMRATQHFDRP